MSVQTKHAAGRPSGWLDMARRRPRQVVHEVITYIALVIGALVFLLPLFWMITTALKSADEIYVFPPVFFPKTFRWQNFPDGWNYERMDFPRWLLNSLILSGVTVVAVLLSSSLVAYGFARISFPGRNFWFMVMLASIMLPAQVTLIPIYIVFYKIGWLDTFKPLLIPPWFGGGAFNIFLLRQFFMGIPKELEDAAYIDGAGRWRIWAQLMLPLSKPALATVAVFTFQGTWNDFYGPLIYLTSIEKFTLALGINMFKGMYTTQVHLMMAMAMLMVVPMIIVFFFAQKFMIQGVILSGMKG